MHHDSFVDVHGPHSGTVPESLGRVTSFAALRADSKRLCQLSTCLRRELHTSEGVVSPVGPLLSGRNLRPLAPVARRGRRAVKVSKKMGRKPFLD